MFAAVWYSARSYPSSWQLDATEGPGRVRVRLRRANLHIPAKFLKPQHQHKAGQSRAPTHMRCLMSDVVHIYHKE